MDLPSLRTRHSLVGGLDYYRARVYGRLEYGHIPYIPLLELVDNKSGGEPYNVYAETFPTGGLTLGPGTYYLALTDGVATVSGAFAEWDNNCLSLSCSGLPTIVNGEPYPGTFSLEILGTAVPEPSTWAMMLLGFAGLGFLGYRQRRKLGLAASV